VTTERAVTAPLEPREKPRPLPRGQHALPREVVSDAQRRRIFESVVRAVAQKGYAATTVSDVIALAGVSRSTFYQLFSDKEDCYLAAYDDGAEAMFQAVVESGAAASDDPFDRFRASIAAYLEALADTPEYGTTFTIEILAAGPVAREHRERAQHQYVELMKAWHNAMRRDRPELPPLPDEVFATAVTAGNELIAERIRAEGAEGLRELEGLIVYTYLALMGLPEEARAAL
jgi:AcrR family transcriptional regulator